MKLVDLNKPISELNGLTLNEVFEGGLVVPTNTSVVTSNGVTINREQSPDLIIVNGVSTGNSNFAYSAVNTSSFYYFVHKYISGSTTSRLTDTVQSITYVSQANMQQNNTGIFTNTNSVRIPHINGTVSNNYNFSLFLYDLTALGIANLNQAQLDNYFALYQSGVEASGFVQKMSKNLFDGKWEIGTIDATTGLPLVNNTTIRFVNFIPILPNTTYSHNGNTGTSRLFFYDTNFNYISTTGGSIPFTTPNDTQYVKMRISSNTNLSTQVQLELGNTATAYQPYRPFALGQDGTVQAQAFIQTAGKDTRVIDAKLPYLNMMSIREVFDSNLVLNHDFSDGLNNWFVENSALWNSFGVVDSSFVGFSRNSTLLTFPRLRQNKSYTINDSIYTYIKNYESTFSAFSTVIFRNATSGSAFLTGLNTSTLIPFQSSIISIVESGTGFLEFNNATITPLSKVSVDEVGQINLTALNLTHLTQAELDAMFALYQAGTLKLSDVFEDNQASSIATLSQTQQDDIAKAYTRYKGPLFIDTDGVAYGQVFISKGGQ